MTTKPEPEPQHYTVSLVFDTECHTAEQAVREAIEWLQNSDFWQLTYRVQALHQDSAWELLDAHHLDPYEDEDEVDFNDAPENAVTWADGAWHDSQGRPVVGEKLNPATWLPYPKGDS
jgi:hypothetical protein